MCPALCSLMPWTVSRGAVGGGCQAIVPWLKGIMCSVSHPGVALSLNFFQDAQEARADSSAPINACSHTQLALCSRPGPSPGAPLTSRSPDRPFMLGTCWVSVSLWGDWSQEDLCAEAHRLCSSL